MIRIIAVGKIKEKFYEDAVAEYAKRLLAFVKLEIIRVADEKCPENLSLKQENMVLAKEGERILKNIRDNDYVVTLEIEGVQKSSEELAGFIHSLEVSGRSDITFVIGGSLGLSDEVKKRSDFALSFSKMTFPHQLMSVVLLEQIYRAYKINRGEPYHK